MLTMTYYWAHCSGKDQHCIKNDYNRHRDARNNQDDNVVTCSYCYKFNIVVISTISNFTSKYQYFFQIYV